MKPKRIMLLRHGQSEGNVDATIYNKKPDPFVNLTDLGRTQAYEAGLKIKEIVGDKTLGVYCSPYYRTRQTWEQVAKSVRPDFIKEDPRLREHEWTGQLVDQNKKAWEKECVDYSLFYFRFTNGESCADTFDRICTFKIDLDNEIAADSYFPENLLIVGHGMTNRIILMKYLGLSVEQFEAIKNPRNGAIFSMVRDGFDEWSMEKPYTIHEGRRRKW